MISKNEILKFAKHYKLPANTIEKDYVLNWMLDGIANHQAFNGKWIFKGGTCLKKCYFEEYRFSEDLDFTITEPNHINAIFLQAEFNKISEWINDESGIQIPEELIRFEEYLNPQGKLSIQGKIAYIGPMRRSGSTPSIKLDLSNDEIVITEPKLSNIHHPYSDTKPMKILSYNIEEIFAEKLRALIQRLRPRDLYDIIHLHFDKRWQPQKAITLSILQKKCDYKKVPLPNMQTIEESGKVLDLSNDWDEMLTHQISNLEPFEYYWEKLPSVFNWLYHK